MLLLYVFAGEVGGRVKERNGVRGRSPLDREVLINNKIMLRLFFGTVDV